MEAGDLSTGALCSPHACSIITICIGSTKCTCNRQCNILTHGSFKHTALSIGCVLLQTPHDRLNDPKIKKQPVKLWKKVVPLAIIFFLSTFNLTLLQALKDAIVVTTSGAEALPFLASFVVLPASLVFFAYYSKMLSIMPKHRVYYLAVAPFVIFYGIFATAIYPVADTLHFHGLFDKVLCSCILQLRSHHCGSTADLPRHVCGSRGARIRHSVLSTVNASITLRLSVVLVRVRGVRNAFESVTMFTGGASASKGAPWRNQSG